jgi:Na+-transporting NADH:ubiquinone oxidoreductase subunit NqrC
MSQPKQKNGLSKSITGMNNNQRKKHLIEKQQRIIDVARIKKENDEETRLIKEARIKEREVPCI